MKRDLAGKDDPDEALPRPQPQPQDADPSSSSSSTSSSDTSSSSSISSDSDSSDGRGHGRVGGLGRGRHGRQHKEAIARIMPFLVEVLREPGAMRRADRLNVREALDRAQRQNIVFWGTVQGAVYKSRRNVEAAIVNLYYTDAVVTASAPG